MGEDIKLHFEFMLLHSALPVIGSLVSYRIAEHLQTGPKSAEELASLASINPSRLFQYLRLASHFEVFAYDLNSREWSNTPRSLILTSSLSRGLWEWHTDPMILDNYIHSNPILASDKEPHIIKNKPPLFETLSQTPELLLKFQKCMTEMTGFILNEIIENINIENSQKVLDVGGADGSLVLGILKRHEHAIGGILDRHEVEPIANKNINDNGLSEKALFHSGNFFESITEGYDCIVMKHIIHDWNDEKASVILKNCRKVLKEGNKLFIVDQIIDKNSESYPTNLAMDHLMLIALGAKERTAQEFEKLLSESGFSLVSVKRVGFEAVIEAVVINS